MQALKLQLASITTAQSTNGTEMPTHATPTSPPAIADSSYGSPCGFQMPRTCSPNTRSSTTIGSQVHLLHWTCANVVYDCWLPLTEQQPSGNRLHSPHQLQALLLQPIATAFQSTPWLQVCKIAQTPMCSALSSQVKAALSVGVGAGTPLRRTPLGSITNTQVQPCL